MLASLMMASCSIARVENLSTSRRRSVGFAGGLAGRDSGCASTCVDVSSVAAAVWESKPVLEEPLVALGGEELLGASSSFRR